MTTNFHLLEKMKIRLDDMPAAFALKASVLLWSILFSLPARAETCACRQDIPAPQRSRAASNSYLIAQLQGNTSATTLQSSTQSNLLKTGTGSTMLQTGASGAMVQGQVEQEAGPINILILVDASYSMKEKLGGGEPKMTSAKMVLENALAHIPTDVNIGLRVFGQGFNNSPEIDCQQSALLVPIGQGNRRSIIEQVRQLHPFGLTPLTYALMQAERDLHYMQGPKTIILISDGAETCGGDPCSYISRLKSLGVNIKIDIVGLGLRKEREAREQLNCIADKSDGKYYDANTSGELVDSISHMVSNAISGRIITKTKSPILNPESPADLAPIVPMTGH